jgi:hypothetical protein
MNGDDRLDIAYKAGCESWVEMPIEMRNDAAGAWMKGWRKECELSGLLQ